MTRVGSAPNTPAITGVSSTIGRTSRWLHVHDDLIGVPDGQKAGIGTIAIHSVTARIVDQDQIGATALGEFRRNSGAGAGADDRPALGQCSAQSFQHRLAVKHAMSPSEGG